MPSTIRNAIILLVVGLCILAGYAVGTKYLQSEEKTAATAAVDVHASYKFGYDNWLGYASLASSKMAETLQLAGIRWLPVEDSADTEQRMKDLADGSLDFAVMTLDTVLRLSKQFDYPVVIIGVVDVSSGGDALVAYSDKAKNLDDFRKSSLRVGRPPESPSDQLMLTTGLHFSLPAFRAKSPNIHDTKNSEDTYQRFKAHEFDAVFLWQPYVAKALQLDNVELIVSTADMQDAVIDVLVVRRELVLDAKDDVQTILNGTYSVLREFMNDPVQWSDEIERYTGLSGKSLDIAVSGVTFVTGVENTTEWFWAKTKSMQTLDSSRLIRALQNTNRVLQRSGYSSTSLLPDNDPYRLVNQKFAHAMLSTFSKAEIRHKITQRFQELTTEQWNRSPEFGTLRLEPIRFKRGSAELLDGSKKALDELASYLAYYPTLLLELRGHTNSLGNADVNRQLSLDRANAVKNYLQLVYDVDINRVRAVGFGSQKPLPRVSTENLRAYRQRLQRVEFVLKRPVKR